MLKCITLINEFENENDEDEIVEEDDGLLNETLEGFILNTKCIGKKYF